MKLVLRYGAWHCVLYASWKRTLRFDIDSVRLIELFLADASLRVRDASSGLVILDEWANETTTFSRNVSLNPTGIFWTTTCRSFILLTVQASVLIRTIHGLWRLAFYQISILMMSSACYTSGNWLKVLRSNNFLCRVIFLNINVHVSRVLIARQKLLL